MADDVKFPIYVVRKGSFDLEQLSDAIQLEAWVVKSEVQNDCYLTWDYCGSPLGLDWNQTRLECFLRSKNPDHSLQRFLNEAGTEWGISVGELDDEIDMDIVYNQLKAEQKTAIKNFKVKSKLFNSFLSTE